MNQTIESLFKGKIAKQAHVWHTVSIFVQRETKGDPSKSSICTYSELYDRSGLMKIEQISRCNTFFFAKLPTLLSNLNPLKIRHHLCTLPNVNLEPYCTLIIDPNLH